MTICPENFAIVSGIGQSQYPLVAFDNALRNAGIGDFNLVKVSSILPAYCVYRESISAKNGSIIYAAYSSITVKEGEIGNTAVAVALPSLPNESGVIFECSILEQHSDLESILRGMCLEAMGNRKKTVMEIKYTSKDVSGIPGLFSVAISAVVMW
jgi:arginine decarboxylase